jgi:hypothetical protein
MDEIDLNQKAMNPLKDSSVQERQEEIRVKGKGIRVNSIKINKNVIIAEGSLIKIASIKDEWYEDSEEPGLMVDSIKNSDLKADIFTFSQRLPEIVPKYNYYLEWDNVAAINIKSYDDWFRKNIPKQSRTHIRRSQKKGVVVKRAEFNDEFVKGIQAIYNESPIRQGKPFWHYGKDFGTLKEIHSTFLDRSDFIGAYYGDDLIGFVKLVYAGETARTMHIFSKNEHRDKAPNNALIAKAVEICAERRISYLVYGQFDYGKLGSDSLALFKMENGFQKFNIPRYYIPLTIKGRVAIMMKLHRGAWEMVPKSIVTMLKNVRKKWYSIKIGNKNLA